jgi:hypothetical protein
LPSILMHSLFNNFLNSPNGSVSTNLLFLPRWSSKNTYFRTVSEDAGTTFRGLSIHSSFLKLLNAILLEGSVHLRFGICRSSMPKSFPRSVTGTSSQALHLTALLQKYRVFDICTFLVEEITWSRYRNYRSNNIQKILRPSFALFISLVNKANPFQTES